MSGLTLGKVIWRRNAQETTRTRTTKQASKKQTNKNENKAMRTLKTCGPKDRLIYLSLSLDTVKPCQRPALPVTRAF